MRGITWTLVCATVLLGAALFAAETETEEPQKAPKPTEPLLKTDLDRFSYSVGINLGRDLKRQRIPLNIDPLLKGLSDALTNAKPLMTDGEIRLAIAKMRQKVAAQQAEFARSAMDNLKRGKEFLTENARKKGVILLPSGLQYRIIEHGDGPRPKPSDTVVVNYCGTLIDGTEFDSSYKNGRPATFTVARVIKGWQEALQLMRKGAKWELFIPSDLAYGEAGAPPVIGPNEVLIFQVELLDIKKAPGLER